MSARLCSGMALFCSLSAAAWEVAWSDELTPLYPDSVAGCNASRFVVETPRNSITGAHLLVSGTRAGEKLTVALPKGGQAFRLVAVPVEENTGINSRTERYGGGLNPYVIRRAPFRIFEALAPYDGPITAGPEAIALRIEAAIPAAATPGTIDLPVSVSDGRTTQILFLTLHIQAATVPPAGPKSFGYTNWFSCGAIAKAHKVDLWSEPFWEVLDRYASLMARGRQNAFIIHLNDFYTRSSQGGLKLEKERLRRYVQTFDRHGLWWIEGGHLAGRTGGSWGSTTLDFSLGGGKTDGPQAAARLDQILGPLGEEIKANGWESRWLQHITDEPDEKIAPAYKALAAETRKRLPREVRLFDATMTQALDGVVDAWCPQVQEYQAHREFFDGQLAQGRQVWVYTCLTPGGKYLNRLLDQERLRPVYLGWSLEKYRLTGFLHWGGTYWTDDPFGRSVHPHYAPDPNNRLPAGDTHVWYPGPDRPWSTTRFEAHRLGLEDAELLRQIRDRQPERHEQLLQANLRAYNDYNTDVDAYRHSRQQLLEAAGR